MSVISVNHAASLTSAIMAKVDNTNVSATTLKKLDAVVARLYGVNNDGRLRAIATPRGKAAFERDIAASEHAVRIMPASAARQALQDALRRIASRTIDTYDALTLSFTKADRQHLKHGVANLENNVRLAYLLGPRPRW